jgi:hypothetical protein
MGGGDGEGEEMGWVRRRRKPFAGTAEPLKAKEARRKK